MNLNSKLGIVDKDKGILFNFPKRNSKILFNREIEFWQTIETNIASKIIKLKH